jgi:hypothetical protein
MNESLITDHEALLLLRQDVQALKSSQDNFHKEMKESFTDLRNNYATRLDVIESEQNAADKRFVAKEAQDKKNDIFSTDIETLQSWKSWTLGFGIGLTCLIGLAGILVGYIFTNNVTSTENAISNLQILITNHINQTK